MTSKVKNLINKNYTYIGLDYGTKKIGIAVGQIITMDARPLKVIHKNKGDLMEQLYMVINEWNPNVIILGYPYANKKNNFMREVDNFYMNLMNKYKGQIDIVKFNEELSTEEGLLISKQLRQENIIKKNKKNVDDIAATLILLSWFRENMVV